MKKQYINLFIIAILLLSVQIANAQQYVSIPEAKRVVEIPGVLVDEKGNYNFDEYEKSIDIIFRTIRDDAPNRTLGDGTVYVLKRNHVYIAGSTIEHQFLDIHIKGEEGSGRMPLILHTKINNQNVVFLRTHKDAILEGFEFDSKNPDNSFASRILDFRGPDSRVIVKNCRLINDRGGSLCIEAAGTGLSLYVYDCLIGNQGHYISLGGNGRGLDIRVNNETGYLDSVVFKNNTFFNLTDRVVRSMGGVVNYMEFDHNTIINNQGYHGSIQFGNTKEAVATNNIFANPIIMGDRTGTNWRNEQTQQRDLNHPDRAFAVVTHNGDVGRLDVSDIKGITMRNNNIFFKKEFLDLFAANPNMFSPNVRHTSDAIKTYLTGDPTKISFTEELPFDYNDFQAGNLGSVSSYKDLVTVLEDFIADPTRSTLSENWSLIYPYEWNASYPTNTQSYTAADGGFPLGDLNWFPSDKAKWMTNSIKSALRSAEAPAGIEINRIYPNPFVDETTIEYTIFVDQEVEISIYNFVGQKINTLKSGYMKQGTYTVTWNGKGFNGTEQARGIYLFAISGSAGKASTRLVKGN